MTTASIAARLALASAACAAALPVAAQQAVVAVSQIVEHPALDACRNGLLAGLEDAGYSDGGNLTFKFQTAQGQASTAAQIAKQFVGESPDVLVGIATPTAQALAAATKSIPIVFTAVTDPVGAKLVSSMARPGGNVTGISDLSPVAQHVDVMAELVPGLKSIGVVYNPGEANSVSLVDLLKESAQARGIKVVEGTATRSSEIQAATQGIAADADIFYAITDNTVATAIAAHTQAASAANKPVFAAETSYVYAGALMAIGFDYYQIGYQTADYVVRILKGADPASLPARVAEGTDIVINDEVARKLGISIPAKYTIQAARHVS